jgi:uncharacterized protein (DUF2267 family)
MATGIDVLDRTEQETNIWLNEIEDRLGVGDRRDAFNALRATLHAVRDRIGADNALHLAAQLPLLVKGVFFEDWRPSETPTRERDKETFLANIDAETFRGLQVAPEPAVRAVLEVLADHIDPAQVDKVCRLFPEGMRDLFPEVRTAPRRRAKRPRARTH